MSETKESTKMMERILEELVFMRSKLPNGELKIIQTSIDDLKHSQDSIKSDVSELKKKLLDPESGVVVRLNQNTQYIQDKKEMEDYYDEIIDQHRDLLSWKNNMTKAMWIVFTAIVGILTKMMFFTQASEMETNPRIENPFYPNKRDFLWNNSSDPDYKENTKKE